MIRHANEDPELLALIRRYVSPELRYMKLSGSLLRMQGPEYDRFARRLSEDSQAITAEEITTLLEGGWRERRAGGFRRPE
ncbi:DUF6000 family protein [Streptomyces viridosporus]|uniref:DUF6000 family protein n=1 Tax=Streptomyces viridosporus TaxID=67581 RepID=UPI00332143E8